MLAGGGAGRPLVRRGPDGPGRPVGGLSSHRGPIALK